MSTLLIHEPPLQVLPSLAAKVGLNEAILLQQVHYWLQRDVGRVVDGRRWIYNSYDGWMAQFPFWSRRTIRRTIAKLEDSGLLDSRDDLNRLPIDRTKWYTINYVALARIEADTERVNLSRPCGQNGHMDGTDCPHGQAKMARPLPETTPETTSDSDNDNRPADTILAYYRQNISPLMAQREVEVLTDWLASIEAPEGETAEDWIMHAINGAIDANTRRLNYVEAILRNIQQSGSLAIHIASRQERKNGQGRNRGTTRGKRDTQGAAQNGRRQEPAFVRRARERRENQSPDEVF